MVIKIYSGDNCLRILFSSFKDSGHFRPLLPYAKALQKRGHQVSLCSTNDLASALHSAGIEHIPFDGPTEEEARSIWARVDAAGRDEAVGIVYRDAFAG